MRKEGIRLVLLSGDSESAAQEVAQRIRHHDVQAQALPADKAAYIQKERAAGHIVAMAGDGVNDAPALAAAHVGIAMSTGTDVAMQNAGITLLHGDLAALVRAIHLSRATVRNIKENLFFAFVYNLIGVPIAAGILYPFFGILLSPMIASAAMTFSSVSVITNALRLRSLSYRQRRFGIGQGWKTTSVSRTPEMVNMLAIRGATLITRVFRARDFPMKHALRESRPTPPNPYIGTSARSMIRMSALVSREIR